MGKGIESFIAHPEDKWSIPDSEKMNSALKNLEAGLVNQDGEAIRNLLANVAEVRAILFDRGDKNSNLLNLHKGLDFLLSEKFGPEMDVYKIDADELLKWLQAEDLPEVILNNDMGISYHLKNDRRFFRVLTIISEEQERLKDKSVFPRSLHDLATWELMVNKNPEQSFAHNYSAVAGAREAGDLILETKARMGVTGSKKLKPKDKVSDYLKQIDVFDDKGISIESVRTAIEAARAYLALARGQWGESANLKIQNLGKAERLSQDALAEGLKMKYSNAIYQANLILSEIYSELKDQNGAEKHLKLAKESQKNLS